jgi:ribonuclease-3
VIVVLERRIGYSFRDPELARSALTHRSTGGGPARSKEHNERLEFLGDSIVGLIAAEWLFRSRGEAPEGTLARLKSFLVSARALSRLARELGLGELLVLGQSEENTGGREKRSLIANAIEAVVGAIYLDGGLEPARQLLVPFFTRLLTEEPELGHQDVKTRLQELLQADGQGLPDYVVVERSGPAHEQLFVVECRVAGVTRGRGEGSSKKGAERGAAEEALAALLVAGASEGDAVRLARNPQS